MKRKTLPLAVAFWLLVIPALFLSCSQADSHKSSTYFHWSIDGGATQNSTAIAYLNDIEATGSKDIEIALHSVNGFPVGTYTMDSSGGNVIGLLDPPNPNLGSMSGTLVITASTAVKVSGSFDVILSDGSNLKGSFSNIEFD